jgi:hypothetical protein
MCAWLLLLSALSTTLAAAAAVQQDEALSQGAGTTDGGIEIAYNGEDEQFLRCIITLDSISEQCADAKQLHKVCPYAFVCFLPVCMPAFQQSAECCVVWIAECCSSGALLAERHNQPAYGTSSGAEALPCKQLSALSATWRELSHASKSEAHLPVMYSTDLAGMDAVVAGLGSYVSAVADPVHMDSHRQRKHSHRHEPHDRHERHAHVSQHQHRHHSSNGAGAPEGSGSMSEPPAAKLVPQLSHSQGPARLDNGTSTGFSPEPLQQQPKQQQQQHQQQPEQQRLLEQQVQQLAQLLEQQRRQLEQQWRQLENQQLQLEQQQRQLQLQEQKQQHLEQSQRQLEQRGQQQIQSPLLDQSQAGSSSGPSTELKVPQGGSTSPTAPGDALQNKGLTGPSQRSQSAQDLSQQQEQQQQQQQRQQLPQLEAPRKPSEAADVSKPTPHLPDSTRQTPASSGSSDQAPAKKRAPDFDDPSTWPDPVEDATREYADADADVGLDSANATSPVKKPPGGYWPYYGQFVPDPDADLPDFPGGAAPGAERRFGEPAPADYGNERKFGDPAPGDYTKSRKLPRALNVTGEGCRWLHGVLLRVKWCSAALLTGPAMITS